MKTDWTYIDSVESLHGVNEVYCDTRDFKIRCITDPVAGDSESDEAYMIPESEVLNWLKSLESISGGKGTWRCLNFRIGQFDEEGWMKYFIMERSILKPNCFIVRCHDIPVRWKECNESTVDKEYLNFCKV